MIRQLPVQRLTGKYRYNAQASSIHQQGKSGKGDQLVRTGPIHIANVQSLDDGFGRYGDLSAAILPIV